ncbi:MAG: hypothetical protein UW81_C0002G0032 [Candidatus Giovannonibacteria bacterium GW2011_GWC2_44_9]|uniref:Uncharacterized protein n=1 Tax=Candidatus Giovannonibacteria bacterium GW2011_GWC2_44_9 TaxID=1618658 RepID=A0A0G1MUG9_9BACT|nr:MAG: hypothetical protein UW81_C0002G0032 [Candidatus Giovannonibacteria bacterium GW2011_GWC2_44_9]
MLMKGYVKNIEKLSLENENFRKVLYTAKNSQLVVMSLKSGEDIGEEIHQLDQFIRCESGEGKAVLDGVPHEIEDGFVVVRKRSRLNFTHYILLRTIRTA